MRLSCRAVHCGYTVAGYPHAHTLIKTTAGFVWWIKANALIGWDASKQTGPPGVVMIKLKDKQQNASLLDFVESKKTGAPWNMKNWISEYIYDKYLFSVLLRMAALLRILLAHSPTLGLGDYMCCVHVKASKPSPPQSWSDCAIIPLTLSPTPPAVRPPFSQDAGRLLPDQRSSAVPVKVGPWVNLSACLCAHWITWELTL